MRSLAVVAVAVVSLSLAGAAFPRMVVVQPTLVVVIVGSGGVVSTPAGIACPGKCTARFAAGASVLLKPKAKSGSPFLRWGGSCTGARSCRVRVSSLAVVGAEFVGGAKAQPQASPQKSLAVPGSYKGNNPQRGYDTLTFSVSADGKSLNNISISDALVRCGGGVSGAPIGILQSAIKPDGSFAATGSQTGVFGSDNSAKFTYSFTGRFQAATAGGTATAAGIFREDVTYLNGTTTCTSNDQSWTASRVP